MEFLNEKNKSGIVKYYGSFKEASEDIRKELIRSKISHIYLMYGSTILNTLSEEISFLLSKKNTSLNVYLMDESNPFLEASSKIWSLKNESYSFANLQERINNSLDLFKEKRNHLKSENSLNGELNVFKNKKSTINYSFYLFDEKLFFVPSKNVSTKEFIPMTILADKTPDKNKNALYNKIKYELELMKSDECFEKVDFDGE